MASLIKAFKDPKLPENFFRLQVTILRMLGIELVKEESLGYKIYSRTILFYLIYSYTFVEALEIYSQWGDMNAIISVCSFLVTHITGVIKTTLLFVNRKKIGNMLKTIHEKPFLPDENRGGKHEEIYVRNVIRSTELMLVVYFAIVSVTLFTGVITFGWTRIFRKKDEWEYPYVKITIIDTSYSPTFEIACIYQISCVMFAAPIIASIYCLLSTMIAHLSVQMKILQNAFRNMRKQAQSMREKNNKFTEIDYMTSLLGEYVEQHLQVFEFAKQLEDLCNIMILLIVLASGIMLCFNLYQSSKSEIGSITFVHYSSYYLIIVNQIYMYCYWGDKVTVESANVAQAVAEVDWVDAPISVKKALILVIARSQRPLRMTAGKFVPLSIETFMKIVKASFSYYLVLKNRQQVKFENDTFCADEC